MTASVFKPETPVNQLKPEAAGAFQNTLSAGLGNHPDLRANAFLERRHMGNDADQFALLTEPRWPLAPPRVGGTVVI